MAITNPLADIMKASMMAEDSPQRVPPSESPEPVRGRGGGLADLVPAQIDNQEPARLSEGEFVFPSDVVSFVGNGSSEAGSRILNNVIKEVRGLMKQGGEKQSKPLSQMVKEATKTQKEKS